MPEVEQGLLGIRDGHGNTVDLSGGVPPEEALLHARVRERTQSVVEVPRHPGGDTLVSWHGIRHQTVESKRPEAAQVRGSVHLVGDQQGRQPPSAVQIAQRVEPPPQRDKLPCLDPSGDLDANLGFGFLRQQDHCRQIEQREFGHQPDETFPFHLQKYTDLDASVNDYVRRLGD